MYTQYAKDILHHDKSFIWSKIAIIRQGCSKEYIYSLPLYQGVQINDVTLLFCFMLRKF